MASGREPLIAEADRGIGVAEDVPRVQPGWAALRTLHAQHWSGLAKLAIDLVGVGQKDRIAAEKPVDD